MEPNSDNTVGRLVVMAEVCDRRDETEAGNVLMEAVSLIKSLRSQLAAYQKYGEPCNWRNMKADAEEIKRLEAESLDLLNKLVDSQRRERAAVEALEGLMEDTASAMACTLCTKENCGIKGIPPRCNPKWRGPQDGKGAAE